MNILLAILLAVVNLVLLASILLGLPGTWLMVLACTIVALCRHGMFSTSTLLVLAALALMGELAELLAGLFGTSRGGGGWRASLAAVGGGVVGAIAGTFVLPLIGSLIGACVGAGVAAAFAHHLRDRQPEDALRVGVWASLGRLLGTVVKFAAGVVIYLVATIASFWP